MTDDRLHQILASARAILLDFDGPVTQLLPKPANVEIATAAKQVIAAAGYDLPRELLTATDHTTLLRYAAELDIATRQDVEAICRELETKAAQNSPTTPGTAEFLEACRTTGRTLVIASNNDADAIDTYLDRVGLTHLVAGIAGRPRGHPELLKPEPHIVREALLLAEADADDAVMIGDSVSDVVASHAAGVRIVGFGKHEARAAELAKAGADSAVSSMQHLRFP